MNWYGVVFFVLWQNFFTASSTRTLHAGLVNRANLPNCPTCPTCPALPPTCPIYPTQPPTQWHGIPNPPTAHGMTSIIHQHRSFEHFSLHYFGTVSAMHLCGVWQQRGSYFVYNNAMIVLYGMGVGIARVRECESFAAHSALDFASSQSMKRSQSREEVSQSCQVKSVCLSTNKLLWPSSRRRCRRRSRCCCCCT